MPPSWGHTPATSAAIWPPAVGHHMAEAETAVTPNQLRFPADPTGDPPDLNMGRLE